MELKFKPEDINFHREEYQKVTAEMRSKDYPPLIRKEVKGRVNLRHRRSNSYTRDGKAMVSFVMAGQDLKNDIRRSIDLLGGLGTGHQIAGPGSLEARLGQLLLGQSSRKPRFPNSCGEGHRIHCDQTERVFHSR